MLDFSHIPSQYPNADVQVFVGSSDNVSNPNEYTWVKPRGKTMGHILLVGNGGYGGDGIVGANSFAGGGGGGGSGGQTSIRFPLWAIPDWLAVRLWGTRSSNNSYVALVHGNQIDNNTLVYARPGGAGGNGTTVPAGGSAGTSAVAATAANMALGWQWLQQALAGQAGAAGSATTNGLGVTAPVTGLLVTGGGGGGAMGAAGTGGTYGGSINGGGVFPKYQTSQSGAFAAVPGANGFDGFQPIPNLLYNYGGAGGGSSHGSATGAGLFGGNGGNGAPGCGGGGGGACLTGGVAGVGGKGGPAFCIITCW